MVTVAVLYYRYEPSRPFRKEAKELGASDVSLSQLKTSTTLTGRVLE